MGEGGGFIDRLRVRLKTAEMPVSSTLLPLFLFGAEQALDTSGYYNLYPRSRNISSGAQQQRLHQTDIKLLHSRGRVLLDTTSSVFPLEDDQTKLDLHFFQDYMRERRLIGVEPAAAAKELYDCISQLPPPLRERLIQWFDSPLRLEILWDMSNDPTKKGTREAQSAQRALDVFVQGLIFGAILQEEQLEVNTQSVENEHLWQVLGNKSMLDALREKKRRTGQHTEGELVNREVAKLDKPNPHLGIIFEAIAYNEMPDRNSEPGIGNLVWYLNSVFHTVEEWAKSGGPPSQVEILININNGVHANYTDGRGEVHQGTRANARSMRLIKSLRDYARILGKQEISLAERNIHKRLILSSFDWLPQEDGAHHVYSRFFEQGAQLINQGLSIQIIDCRDGAYIARTDINGAPISQPTQGARRQLIHRIAQDRLRQSDIPPTQQLVFYSDIDYRYKPGLLTTLKKEAQALTKPHVWYSGMRYVASSENEGRTKPGSDIQSDFLVRNFMSSLLLIRSTASNPDTTRHRMVPLVGCMGINGAMAEAVRWDISKDVGEDSSMFEQVRTLGTHSFIPGYFVSIADRVRPESWAGNISTRLGAGHTLSNLFTIHFGVSYEEHMNLFLYRQLAGIPPDDDVIRLLRQAQNAEIAEEQYMPVIIATLRKNDRLNKEERSLCERVFSSSNEDPAGDRNLYRRPPDTVWSGDLQRVVQLAYMVGLENNGRKKYPTLFAFFTEMADLLLVTGQS